MNIRRIRQIETSSRGINTILLLNDKRIATGSNDKAIRVYNISTFECEINETKAHDDFVINLSQLDNNNLLSCSLDNTIKMWIIYKTSLKCIYTITNKASVLKVIPISNNTIAFCSTLNYINIYNLKLKQVTTSLSGHKEFVRTIHYAKEKDILISGSDDEQLILWKSNKVHIIQNINPCFTNSIIQVNSDLIAIGGKGIVWIVNINECCIDKKIILEGIFHINSLITYKDYLICGTYLCKIVYIDLKHNAQYKVLSENIMSPCIEAMCYIGNDTFIEGSSRKNMNVWSIIQ